MLILLVEDDSFFRKFYAQKLTEKGYQIEEAGDGVEGLEKIRTKKPDIVVLDIIMPNKDGFEVLEALSQDDSLKKIPVLVFSTLGQESDMEKAKKLGAVDFVNKSLFDLDELVAKIKQITKS